MENGRVGGGRGPQGSAHALMSEIPKTTLIAELAW